MRPGGKLLSRADVPIRGSLWCCVELCSGRLVAWRNEKYDCGEEWAWRKRR